MVRPSLVPTSSPRIDSRLSAARAPDGLTSNSARRSTSAADGKGSERPDRAGVEEAGALGLVQCSVPVSGGLVGLNGAPEDGRVVGPDGEGTGVFLGRFRDVERNQEVVSRQGHVSQCTVGVKCTSPLGGPVLIHEDAPGKAGTLEIRYLDLDHLERLLDRLL